MTEPATPARSTPAEEAGSHPWADLPAEQFDLLRLAPLPGGRNRAAQPLRFARLGRVERHSPQQSLLRLTVELPEQALSGRQNRLEVWADHRSREVRLGLDEGFLVEPQDRGLGSFLMAQGIAWAQQRFSAYAVEGQALSAKDAFSDEDRARREHFLRALGFEISYEDPLQLKGRCAASHVGALHPRWNSEKVQRLELLDSAAMLQQADRSIRELEIRLRKREERISQLEREDGTLRFSIACLVVFCTFQAGLLIWMATR